MLNPFPVHHLPRVCNKKIKHTNLCFFHMQLTTGLSRSRSRSRSFWSRCHNRFLVSVSVSISVSHSLVSVLALVLLCSGLINKPACFMSHFLVLVSVFSSRESWFWSWSCYSWFWLQHCKQPCKISMFGIFFIEAAYCITSLWWSAVSN